MAVQLTRGSTLSLSLILLLFMQLAAIIWLHQEKLDFNSVQIWATVESSLSGRVFALEFYFQGPQLVVHD